MQFFQSRNTFIAIILLLIFSCYLYLCPNFIQGGDTSELVASAYFNLVAHPPGYPLWLLFQKYWTHNFPFGSIFWKAAVLNSIFGILTLCLVLTQIRQNKFLIIIFASSLAFSPSFLQASVLPDVFSLNALLVSIICFMYINEKSSLRVRQFSIPFFFFLGFANHHTIIFVFPIVCDFLISSFKNEKNNSYILLGTFAGITATLLLYLSLLHKNPSSYYSWGEVNSLPMLFNHIIRKDYGTFQLAANQEKFQFNFSAIYLFLKLHLIHFSSLTILLFFAFGKKSTVIISKKLTIILLSFCFSIIFLGLANFKVEGMGIEVISRFYLLPFILLAFISLLLLNYLPKFKPNLFNILAILVILFCITRTSYVEFYNNKSLSSDSLFEHSANILLTEAHESHASIILSTNDNSYFNLRYLKLLNPKYNNIAIVSPALLFHEWYWIKLHKLIPNFILNNRNTIFNLKKMDEIEDLIKPNLQTYSFIFENNFQDSKNYKITYLQLGRMISLGNGVFFKNENIAFQFPKHFNLDLIANSFQGFSKKSVQSHYSHYHLARGQFLYSQKDVGNAKASWLKAIELVPYCYPAYFNICKIESSPIIQSSYCKPDFLTNMKKSSEGFF